jgi:hypothetical protein
VSNVIRPAAFRAARVAALQHEMLEAQAELVGLLLEEDLVGRTAVEAEIAAIAPARPVVAPPRPPRRRRRRKPPAVEASPADIEAARAAARRGRMLAR